MRDEVHYSFVPLVAADGDHCKLGSIGGATWHEPHLYLSNVRAPGFGHGPGLLGGQKPRCFVLS